MACNETSTVKILRYIKANKKKVRLPVGVKELLVRTQVDSTDPLHFSQMSYSPTYAFVAESFVQLYK